MVNPVLSRSVNFLREMHNTVTVCINCLPSVTRLSDEREVHLDGERKRDVDTCITVRGLVVTQRNDKRCVRVKKVNCSYRRASAKGSRVSPRSLSSCWPGLLVLPLMVLAVAQGVGGSRWLTNVLFRSATPTICRVCTAAKCITWHRSS